MNQMDEVNQRANLAFSNHMELLTFFLTDRQQYGINVFKIIEVIETPKAVTKMPESHPAVVGAIDFRGKVVSVIDLGLGLGLTPVNVAQELSYVIICEYSGTIQGLLVSSPNNLLNKSWEEIKSPGETFKDAGYLTALTYQEDGEAIQILDVEKILGEIIGADDVIAQEILVKSQKIDTAHFKVLVIDDSKAARQQIETTLGLMKTPFQSFDSAVKAWEFVSQNFETSKNPLFDLIISDIEMPGMDGFTFTRKMKAHHDVRLSGIPLVLHSSMSNDSNRMKAKDVGADEFIPKYQADSIATLVLKWYELARQ